MDIVTCAYGKKVNNYILPFVRSAQEYIKESNIYVVGKSVPFASKYVYQYLRDNYKLPNVSPGCLKTLGWLDALPYCKSKWILFIDVDTLILSSLDDIILDAETKDVDILFTVRSNQKEWLNAGVLILRNNTKMQAFLKSYVEQVKVDCKRGFNDQHTLINLLNRSQDFVNKISSYEDKPHIEVFKHKDIVFGAVPAQLFNSQSHSDFINKDQKIIHLKGVLSTVLLRDMKDLRYLKLLIYFVFKYSIKEIQSIQEKIDLFNSYEPEKKGLNLSMFYKRFFIFYKLFAKPIASLFYYSRNIIRSR